MAEAEDDEFAAGNGQANADEDAGAGAGAEGIEIVSVADEGGHGVYLSCAAQVRSEDLLSGLCDLVQQVTRAMVANPGAERAGELGLGDELAM